MKIAFCISGHLRNYKRLKENFYEFKRFIEQFGSVDTFVTTYNNRNTTNSWSVQHGLNETDSHNDIISLEMVKEHYQTNNVEIIDDQFLSSSFSPLKYTNITYKSFRWELDPSMGNSSYGIHNNIINSTKMFYLIYRCNMQKLYQEYHTNTEYDFVFRMRPDMQFFHQAYSHLLRLDQLDKTKIHVPEGHWAWTDQFAYGSSTLMNKYSNAFLRISGVHDRDIFGEPERVMKEALTNLLADNEIIRVAKCGYLLAENPNSHIVHR
jgi:hypothetical protein